MAADRPLHAVHTCGTRHTLTNTCALRPQCMCGGQRATYRSWFSTSPLIPGKPVLYSRCFCSLGPPLDLKRSNTETLFGRGHLIWECIGQACKCQLHLKITRVDDRLRGTHSLHPRIVGAPPTEVLEIMHPPHVKSRPQCLSGTCGPVYKESVRETEALKILTGI